MFHRRRIRSQAVPAAVAAMITVRFKHQRVVVTAAWTFHRLSNRKHPTIIRLSAVLTRKIVAANRSIPEDHQAAFMSRMPESSDLTR